MVNNEQGNGKGWGGEEGAERRVRGVGNGAKKKRRRRI